MRNKSETRKELEQSVRSLLPEDVSLGEKADGETPNIAAIGLGGLFTGSGLRQSKFKFARDWSTPSFATPSLPMCSSNCWKDPATAWFAMDS